MEIFEPTKKEIFLSLKNVHGCCWLGGKGCECYSRQLKSCFEEEKRRLTKKEFTEKELDENIKKNTEVWTEIMSSGIFDL